MPADNPDQISPTTLIGKFVLGMSAIAFIGYGLTSLVSPDIPAGLAGIAISNADGFAEVGAMYGGLQTGIGLFCLLSLIKADFYRAGLVLLALAIGSLALARLLSVVVSTGEVSGYTYGALAYEFATIGFAAYAILKAK